ncbi:MAG: NYN domain-containing protein [Thermoleophilia bacterium]
MAEHESSLAVLVDFENMARPGAKGRGDFDIHLVLNRLAEKGRVLVKRAYADWSRYRDARHELQNAGLGLIEMPSAREGAKNRADIQMAVDAMELAYSREHVDNFVIVSGDSDFTPLVGKLRELNKRVIGVGNRESASELLIANCDEFIFYDLLAARAAGGGSRRGGAGSGAGLNPVQLLQETLIALQREGVEWPLASIVKDSMRRKYPAFDESEHGFSTFSKFLEDAGGTGMVRLETDPRSGTYRVELGTTVAAPPVAAPAPAAERGGSGEETEGSRRRRRRGGRGRSEGSTAQAAPAAEALAPDAEVFEVVVTPTPDLDVGTLPPLDEPISYEDMIMLGPEVEEDVPELVEATDVSEGEPPARSSRRRRRRGAGADPEPTIEDLEPVTAEDVAPAAEAEAPAEEAEAEAEGTTRRRRRRRTAAEPAPTPGDESFTPPSGDALLDAAPAAEEAPAEEEAPAPSRRRVRRRSTAAAEEAPAAEAVAEPVAEPAAEEEAPKPKRRTRAKKAAEPTPEEAPAAEAVAEAAAEEEAPKPKRRTRAKKAAEPTPEEAPAAEAVAEPAAEEEAPKPKRRTRAKKAAEPAPEEAPAAEAEEAPKPKRRTRAKKAAEPAPEAEETPAAE